MPSRYSRRRSSSSKKAKRRPKSKKMRGGVTRKKLLTRRKVADLTREIGLGHGGSLVSAAVSRQGGLGWF